MVGRTEAAARVAKLVRPGSASVGSPGLGASGCRAMLKSAGSQLVRQSVAPSSHRAYTSGFRSRTIVFFFRRLIRVAADFDMPASNTDKI